MPTDTKETKEKPPLVSDDPFIRQLFTDVGLVVNEGEIQKAAPAPETEAKEMKNHSFVTLGEAAKSATDRAKEKEEKKTEPTADEKAKEQPKEGEKKAEDKPDPKTKEEPKVKEGEAKDEPEEKPKPTIKVERSRPIEELVETAVRRSFEENRAVSDKAKEEPKETVKTDPDAEYVQSLDEDRRYDLEVLDFAAKSDPKKYGDAPKKMVAFYRKLDSYIAEKQKESPEWDGSGDTEYTSFVEENSPRIGKTEIRRMERAMASAEAEQRLEEKLRPEREEVSRRVRAQELKPEIDQATESFRASVFNQMAETKEPLLKPVMTQAKEKGYSREAWSEAEVLDKLAVQYVHAYTNQAVDLGREYLEIATEVKERVKVDPKLPLNSDHNKLAAKQGNLFRFIDQQEDVLSKAPASIKIKEGRNFVSREEYAALPEAQRARHWTLGHEDVLHMLAFVAREQAEINLKSEVQRLKDAGFVREPKIKEAKKEEKKTEEPKEIVSPKATTSQSPGAGNSTPLPQGQGLMTEEEKKHYLSTSEKRWAG